jgi:hypothetical protein
MLHFKPLSSCCISQMHKSKHGKSLTELLVENVFRTLTMNQIYPTLGHCSRRFIGKAVSGPFFSFRNPFFITSSQVATKWPIRFIIIIFSFFIAT